MLHGFEHVNQSRKAKTVRSLLIVSDNLSDN